MFRDLLRANRERSGRTVKQAARRLGVPLGTYRKRAIDVLTQS